MTTRPNPSTADLAGEVAAALTLECQHLTSRFGLSTAANAAVLPQSLLAVLAATVALNYQRIGHAPLLEQSMTRLREMVDDAHKMSRGMSAEDVATVNPMAPCSCGPDAEGDAVARAVAAALGLPASAVRAVSVPSAEMSAVEKSDDPSAMAGVAAEVDEMLARIFGAGTSKH